MRPLPLLAAALLLCSCGWVSFGRRLSAEEIVLESEIKSYYQEVAAAFASGSPQRLASLFDPEITRPMSHPEIAAWSEKFFGEHRSAHFVIEAFELETLGHQQAWALLRYRVVTPNGEGSFSGAERDRLTRRGGRWRIAEWEKVP